MAPNIDHDELKTVINDTLERHNFYREKHNVPALRIDSKLNVISQDWADKMVKENKASHRPNNEYGENIFIIQSSNKVTELGVKAVDSWYSEIEFFNFQGTDTEMDASIDAFHFTQLIWKSCKKLGVGVSECPKSGKIYLVCNYDPRGNFKSQFKENVLPSRREL